MVDIPAGSFEMGSVSASSIPGDGEGPTREVTLGPYSISTTCVTNAQFASFVDQSGYVTDAERFGWSFVFEAFVHPAAVRDVLPGRTSGAPWWRGVRGAAWNRPFGRGSCIDGIDDHPVVHVSWNDAHAFADWSHTRLPTEAEWERAARGGLERATYPWGENLTSGGEHQANIWQGTFPEHNTGEDGFIATAPADAFAPNGFGLHCVVGNVWEWVADWHSLDWHAVAGDATRVDPTGPLTGTHKSLRGGSHLCHASYCNRYRVSARTSNEPDASLGHTGFRIAADR